MRFKIDENLHSDAADLLRRRRHGHDATTVYDQGLRGKADVDIATVCRTETRAIPQSIRAARIAASHSPVSD